MPNGTSWLTLEIVTYYAQIVAAVVYLFLSETLLSHGSFVRQIYLRSPRVDYIESNYDMVKMTAEYLSLTLVGINALIMDKTVACPN